MDGCERLAMCESHHDFYDWLQEMGLVDINGFTSPGAMDDEYLQTAFLEKTRGILDGKDLEEVEGNLKKI